MASRDFLTVNKKYILVIEDDLGIQAITKFSLEMDRHWKVITALNGKEGLFKAMNTNPDVILLDLIIPDISGFAILQKLQKDPVMANIPVILFTAKAIESEIIKLDNSNVVGLITKPFDCLTLSARISEFLAQKAQVVV